MDGMNFMFHLFSGLTLIGLVVLLVKLQKQRDFAKDLVGIMSKQSQVRPYLDTPDKFLAKFCQLMNIEWQTTHSSVRLPYCRIERRPWTDLILTNRILLIRLNQQSRKIDILTESAVPQEFARIVAESMGKNVNISIETDRDISKE
jgi:hypothetical protein